MSITPADWFEFARSLLADSEASSRTAVSRAYYAGYHLCKEFADFLEVDIPRGQGSHGALIDALAGWNDESPDSEREKSVRKLGLRLSRVRTMRTRADYDVSLTHRPQHAQDAIDEVNSLFSQGGKTRKLFPG